MDASLGKVAKESARRVADRGLAQAFSGSGGGQFLITHGQSIGQTVGLIAGVGSAARAVSLFAAPERPGLIDSPLLWLAFAVLVFGAVARRYQSERPLIGPEPDAAPGVFRRSPIAFALGPAGLVVVADALNLAPQPVLIAGWITAQIVWLFALLPRLGAPRRSTFGLARGVEIVAVGLILAAAALARLWDADTLSPVFSTDMASHGLQSRELLAGRVPDFFGAGWAGIPVIGFLPTAITMLVFGDNLAGLNAFAVLAGVGSILGLYLLARHFWGWRPALFAAALVAFDLHSLHYSRGAEYIDPLFFIVWALYFLLRALRRGRAIDFALAGLFAAYSLLMYYPGRLVVPLVVAVLAAAALWQPRAILARRRGLAIAVASLLIAGGPTLFAFISAPEPFQSRVDATSVFADGNWRHTDGKYKLDPGDQTGVMLEQLKRSTLGYWKYNDAAPQFAIERPLLNPASGVLLILGLGCAIWRPRRPAHLLALVWLGGYILASVITIDPPSSSRMLGQVLPVGLLCGLGVDAALRLLGRFRRLVPLAIVVGFLVIGYSASRNWGDYRAWTWAPDHAYPRNQVLSFLLAQPAAYNIYLVSPQYADDHSDFEFLLPDRTVRSLDLKAVQRGDTPTIDAPAIVIMAPEAQALGPRIQARYPDARLIDGSYPPRRGVFTALITEELPGLRPAPQPSRHAGEDLSLANNALAGVAMAALLLALTLASTEWWRWRPIALAVGWWQAGSRHRIVEQIDPAPVRLDALGAKPEAPPPATTVLDGAVSTGMATLAAVMARAGAVGIEAPASERPAIRTARWVGFAVGIAAAGRAVSLFPKADRADLLVPALIWLAIGAITFGAATFTRAPKTPWITPTKSPELPAPGARRVALALAVGIGALAIGAYALNLAVMPVLVASWLVAPVLLLIALAPVPRLPRKLSIGGWVEVAGVGAVLLVAAWIRLHDNGTLPLAFHGDTASYGLEARRLLAGQYGDFFGFGWASIPLIAFWPTAISIWLFGDNLAGLNTVAGIEGVASLVALYLLARELWGRRPALFALILGAGNIYLIHYSRAAQYMDPVVFTAWALYFLVLGLRRGQGWAFAAAGLAAGYSVSMYYSGRLVIPLLIAAVAIAALFAPRALVARRWGLLFAALGFGLALGPALVSWIGAPGLVGDRTNQVWVLGNPAIEAHLIRRFGLAPGDVAGVLLEQFKRSALVFWKYFDAATQFGIERPMLGAVGGILLALGLGSAIARLRRPAELLILVWLGGYIVSNALTVDAPASMRTVGMALPVAILGGLALDRGLSLFNLPIRGTIAAFAIGLSLAALVSLQDWQDYVRWGTNPRTETTRVRISRYLLDRQPVYQVRTVSRAYWWRDREFQFLLPAWRGDSLDPDAVAGGLISWPTEPTVFVVAKEEADKVLPVLRARYPGGHVDSAVEPTYAATFTAFYTQ